MDLALKKQVLRTFTYGLYAVSSANEGEVNICTVNWLTQVSFDPPLLAVSIENDSKTLPMVLRSRKFTVNVFRSGERELAGKLGKSAIKSMPSLSAQYNRSGSSTLMWTRRKLNPNFFPQAMSFFKTSVLVAV